MFYNFYQSLTRSLRVVVQETNWNQSNPKRYQLQPTASVDAGASTLRLKFYVLFVQMDSVKWIPFDEVYPIIIDIVYTLVYYTCLL